MADNIDTTTKKSQKAREHSTYRLVYQAGLLVPATPEGKPWPQCTEYSCDMKNLQLQRPDIKSTEDISLTLIEKQVVSQRAGENIQQESLNVFPDGFCTVIWVFYPGVGLVIYYDPTDPDCPPY